MKIGDEIDLSKEDDELQLALMNELRVAGIAHGHAGRLYGEAHERAFSYIRAKHPELDEWDFVFDNGSKKVTVIRNIPETMADQAKAEAMERLRKEWKEHKAEKKAAEEGKPETPPPTT